MIGLIVKTGKVEITHGKFYLCYQAEDNELLIDRKIEELFRKNLKVPLRIMVSQEGKKVEAFHLLDVAFSLKRGPLQWITSAGIITMVQNAIDKGISKEERELGEFDRMILKALEYNPKKKKE